MNVLIMEDEKKIATAIRDCLASAGYQPTIAASGDAGILLLEKGKYDAIILDWMLPGRDGIEVLDWLRRRGSKPPVLLLTAKDAIEDRVKGLDSGADDYLVKPFAAAELLARLQAIIRRTSGGNLAPTETMRIGDLRLQFATREAHRGTRRLTLTNMGFLILQKLMQCSPAIVLRADLEAHLWGDEPPGSDSLRTHIAHLRATLDPPGSAPMLHTHRGVGFQILPHPPGTE